eukprot:6646808-Alexandrium_andersonii.AAC.1
MPTDAREWALLAACPDLTAAFRCLRLLRGGLRASSARRGQDEREELTRRCCRCAAPAPRYSLHCPRQGPDGPTPG